jgi:hypothetical protein
LVEFPNKKEEIVGILETIAAKLERADLCDGHSSFHTVIDLVFKPGQVLTEEDEDELLVLIKAEIQPERVYVCRNPDDEDGKKLKAFLHLHDFDPEKSQYLALLKELKVRA